MPKVRTRFITVSPPGGGLNSRQKVPLPDNLLRVGVSNSGSAEVGLVGDDTVVWTTTGNSGGVGVPITNGWIELLPQINGIIRDVDIYVIFRPGSANTNGLTFVADYLDEE